MAEVTFYRCNKCGNLVAVVNKGGCTPTCCGEPMEELKAGSTDAATEKHVPVLETDGHKLTVTVGSVEHPMLEEHSIQWIALAADDRLYIRYLKPGDKPTAKFCINGANDVTVYEYCNLHGLWKADL